MFQETRLRLAVWYTTITAILLLLFMTGVYFYVRHTLVERIDDTLKHVVEVVNRSLVIQPIDKNNYRLNVAASFRNNADSVEDDHIDLEWFNPDGQLLWSTFSDFPEISLNLNKRIETVSFSRDRQLRQVTERIERNHQILGYLRVSHPWFEVTKPIQQLIVDLGIGLIVMVSSVAAIGWFLSGLAMQPIKESYQRLKQFTADASHELRNPIAVIQTNVQMSLAYPEAEPERQQQQLKVIERLTQRLGNLVNDLLFLARSDSETVQLDAKSVPLDALLLEVIEEQRLTAEQKGITLTLNIEESQLEPEQAEAELFTLPGDWDQLARLFTNLISNALEYTKSRQDKAAMVTVTLKRVKRDRACYLNIIVQDTGEGIPEKDLPHIFDRFYRVDPARSHQNSRGTGLGLAIAQVIAENHQGKISVESKVNQGTIFTVNLPISCQLPINSR